MDVPGLLAVFGTGRPEIRGDFSCDLSGRSAARRSCEQLKALATDLRGVGGGVDDPSPDRNVSSDFHKVGNENGLLIQRLVFIASTSVIMRK